MIIAQLIDKHVCLFFEQKQIASFPVTKEGAEKFLNFLAESRISKICVSSSIDFPEEELTGKECGILWQDFGFNHEID